MNDLILRNYKISDAERLYNILNNDTEIAYWCGFKQPNNINDSIEYINSLKNEKYWYAICNDNDEVIGSISLVNKYDGMELGYWISKEYRRNHIIYNFCKKIIDYAFNILNINVIYCGWFEGNFKSEQLQKKLGFKEYNIINVPYATGKEHISKKLKE